MNMINCTQYMSRVLAILFKHIKNHPQLQDDVLTLCRSMLNTDMHPLDLEMATLGLETLLNEMSSIGDHQSDVYIFMVACARELISSIAFSPQSVNIDDVDDECNWTNWPPQRHDHNVVCDFSQFDEQRDV